MGPARADRSQSIIGVVGRTWSTKEGYKPKPKEQELLDLAEEVGTLVADSKRAVLLTGGHHKRPEASVKYCALVGAQKATKAATIALIGILPASISHFFSVTEVRVDIHRVQGERLRYLYAHTQLPSEQRNEITGKVADALIALDGGDGTAMEVAIALEAKRPVVFLNSWSNLEGKLHDLVEQNRLSQNSIPSDPIKSLNPQSAVNTALSAVHKLSGTFPDVKHLYPNSGEIAIKIRDAFNRSLLIMG